MNYVKEHANSLHTFNKSYQPYPYLKNLEVIYSLGLILCMNFVHPTCFLIFYDKIVLK